MRVDERVVGTWQVRGAASACRVRVDARLEGVARDACVRACVRMERRHALAFLGRVAMCEAGSQGS